MNISDNLVPYLILHELADVAAFKAMMQENGIEITLQWRYYYGYNDAIRIIDFVETKGIYDAWVVFLPEDGKEKADQLVVENSTILKYFESTEEHFLRGLNTPILEKALGSQQMKGRSLELALEILKEQNISYTMPEIQALKEALVVQNERKASKVFQTKILIWCLIITVVIAYLWLAGLFE